MYFVNKGILWRTICADFIPKTNYTFDGLSPPYIIKPIDSYGQEGIVISYDKNDIKDNDKDNVIVSELINNPMLWYEDDKAYKFHLRVYLAVYVSEGISRVFLNKYTKILTASKPYNTGSTDNDVMLTGGSRTKYIRSWDKDAIDHIDKKYDVNTCWQNIHNMCITIGNTIGCLVMPYSESNSAYEVFGLDVMLDENMKAWLIEINDRVGYYDVITNQISKSVSEIMFNWQLDEIIKPHFFGKKLYDTLICTTQSRQRGSLSSYAEQLMKIRMARLEDHLEDHKELVNEINIDAYKYLGNGEKYDLKYVNGLMNTNDKHYYIAYNLNDNLNDNDNDNLNDNTHILGFVQIRPLNKESREPQLRYFVVKNKQRQGLGTAMVAMAIELYARSHMGNSYINAMIKPDNIASIKLVLKLGFKYQGQENKGNIILNKYSRNLRIVDDFPYYKKWLLPFDNMYKELKQIKFNFSPRERHLYIVDRTYPTDYTNTDCIADWFAESVRVLCREKDYKSPIEVFNEMKNKELKNKELKENKQALIDARESIYQISRGCNLFNVALGIALFKGINRLLDCTAGWGDRLIAADIAGVKLYRGFDTNYQLQAVYKQIMAEIALCKDKTSMRMDWSIEYMPFEDCRLVDKFDAALMSPPFYDQELYLGELTSTSRYKTENEWYQKFYNPMITKAVNALDIGGKILMYIPPNRMLSEAKRTLSKLKYLGVIGFRQLYNGKGKIRDTYVWVK